MEIVGYYCPELCVFLDDNDTGNEYLDNSGRDDLTLRPLTWASASWDEIGNPETLAAAATDALDWLRYFRDGGSLQTTEGQRKLKDCATELERLLAPDVITSSKVENT